MFKFKNLTAIAIVATCTAPAFASFGTVTAKFTGIEGGGIGMTVNGGGNSSATNVGLFNFDLISATGEGTLLSDPFETFCIDLEQFISNGATHTWDVVLLQDAPDPPSSFAPMGAAKAALVNELWAEHRDDANPDDSINNRAAFQLALWEIVYEDVGATYAVESDGSGGSAGFHVSSGLTAAVTTTANSWLADVLDVGAPSAVPLRGMVKDGAQDFAIPVPVPAAWLLGAIGLSAVAGLRRRFS